MGADQHIGGLQSQVKTYDVTFIAGVLSIWCAHFIICSGDQVDGATGQWLFVICERTYNQVHYDAGNIHRVDIVTAGTPVSRAPTGTVGGQDTKVAFLIQREAVVVYACIVATSHIQNRAPLLPVPCGVEMIEPAQARMAGGGKIKGAFPVIRRFLIPRGIDDISHVDRGAVFAFANECSVVQVKTTIAAFHIRSKEEDALAVQFSRCGVLGNVIAVHTFQFLCA